MSESESAEAQNGEASSSSKKREKKKTMMLQLQSLNEEMEICMHHVMERGQFKRKLPKEEASKRTAKRISLEKKEEVKTEKDGGERMRGSMVALEQSMIEASRIIRKAQQEEQKTTEETKEPSTASTSAEAQPAEKKFLYKMPKIKSQRLAASHGQALAAHASGKFQEAIQILNKIAAEAPSAPQVYSSLGMVYESLKNWEKAYGAYHVAAVLCKRDYSMWARAGFLATKVGGKKWLEHALMDYTAADRLKPPGSEIPCKLAAVHLELGNLADCLTILTDLSDGGVNYWNLYASCLLKLGYACLHQRSDNYMVKRWLRKYSQTFDWQGRRLQALVMALEHAAGSEVCQKLRDWAVQRVIEEEEENSGYDEDNDDQVDSENRGNQNKENEQQPRITQIEMPAGDQRLSASIAQVCAIGAELMKHCLGLEAFEGCQLVGEAISAYLKERGNRRRNRLAEREASLSKSQNLNPFSIAPAYDDGDDDESDEDAGLYLSDDDEIENNDDPEFVQSIERGVLPPELQVLYGLGLIGMGGRRFLAGKCLEAALLLSDEDTFQPPDSDEDPSWQLFSAAMTSTLNKTSAFAFVADLLHKIGKEEEWASVIRPLLKNHLKAADLDLHSQDAPAISPADLLQRSRLTKILLAEIRFDLYVCEEKLEKDDTLEEGSLECLRILDHIMSVLRKIWKIQKSRTLNPICCELVHLIAKGSRLSKKAVMRKKKDDNNSFCVEVVEKLQDIVQFVFQIDSIGSHENDDSSENNEFPVDWKELPISSEWQDRKQRSLTLSAYNNLVASHVTLFSGWEKAEFSLNLMKRRDSTKKEKHFGISLYEGRVAGKLDQIAVMTLSGIWRRLSAFLNTNLDFDQLHEDAIDAIEAGTKAKVADVALFSEDAALAILLNYAHLCSLAMDDEVIETEDNEIMLSEDQKSLIKTILSIILPVTQFCVTEKIWDSKIGWAATSLSGFDEWRNIAVGDLDMPSSPERPKTRRRQSQLPPKFKGEASDMCLKKLLKIPVVILKKHWDMGDVAVIDPEQARIKQEHVERCMIYLRESITEVALQKCSLETAVALIDIIPFCQNPFVPLLQAPSFCHQALRRGNHDVRFKSALPKNCKAIDALQILGRAECLSAIDFGTEAIFLTSYVVKTCKKNPPYNGWQMARFCAYNTSLSIQSKSNEGWERDVIEDLKQFGKEGITFMRNEGLQVPGDTSSNAMWGDMSQIAEDMVEAIIVEEPKLVTDIKATTKDIDGGNPTDTTTGEIVAV